MSPTFDLSWVNVFQLLAWWLIKFASQAKFSPPKRVGKRSMLQQKRKGQGDEGWWYHLHFGRNFRLDFPTRGNGGRILKQIVYLRASLGNKWRKWAGKKEIPYGMCYPMGKLILSPSREPFRVCRTHLTFVPLKKPEKAEVSLHHFPGGSGSSLVGWSLNQGDSPWRRKGHWAMYSSILFRRQKETGGL